MARHYDIATSRRTAMDNSAVLPRPASGLETRIRGRQVQVLAYHCVSVLAEFETADCVFFLAIRYRGLTAPRNVGADDDRGHNDQGRENNNSGGNNNDDNSRGDDNDNNDVESGAFRRVVTKFNVVLSLYKSALIL